MVKRPASDPGAPAGWVRPSTIAGTWYPGDPAELTAMLRAFLAVPEAADGPPLALIAPHAGYVYSGQTAAYAYRQVQGAGYDVVAVVSPLHRIPLGRFAVSSAIAYQTPLGLVKLDSELVGALEQQLPIKRVGHDGEHSLEIQLPFLQLALGDFALLPVMIGESSFEAGEELGTALAMVLKGKQALLVASTDLHHMDNYDQVVRRDKTVVDAIASFDLGRIKEALAPWDCSVCGRIPVVAVLAAARALGANRMRILHHTNSGDVTGIRTPGQYTVGYLAAAAYIDR